jgi:Pup amidohydrolase
MSLGILAGVETEYGLSVEGHGAEDQIEDSMALVRGYPDECHPVWDYRYESPRSDLRGFVLRRLAVDPIDARFDTGRRRSAGEDLRADRILPNGARFYNDHGHPEYATPECLSASELALHDKAGEVAVLRAARAMEQRDGLRVRIYKNNTDHHGASYGTHESYLAPRSLGFDKLFPAVLPMLVARQILTGAGKVGSEQGRACRYQISQRADFLSEAANAETLYRRPVFNTRDEPHAAPSDWIRLHVISGDANMIASATARKVGLVQIAVALAEAGEAPPWALRNPVEAFQSVSRDETRRFRIELEGGSWTTAIDILESYLAAAERVLDLGLEEVLLLAECRSLLAGFPDLSEELARKVDWAAKLRMLERYLEAESSDWDDPSLAAFDLEYHNLEPEEGLFFALEEEGALEPVPAADDLLKRLSDVFEPTRARARGIAVRRFKEELHTACWRSLTFRVDGDLLEVDLPPRGEYPPQLEDAPDVETFIERLRGVQ